MTPRKESEAVPDHGHAEEKVKVEHFTNEWMTKHILPLDSEKECLMVLNAYVSRLLSEERGRVNIAEGKLRAAKEVMYQALRNAHELEGKLALEIARGLCDKSNSAMREANYKAKLEGAVSEEREKSISIIRKYLSFYDQRAISWHAVNDCIEAIRSQK